MGWDGIQLENKPVMSENVLACLLGCYIPCCVPQLREAKGPLLATAENAESANDPAITRKDTWPAF